MQICFLDTAPFNYTPLTLAQAPLDGARSALCDLAREMASQHQVTLINRARRPAQQGTVRHLQFESLTADFWTTEDFDAIVALDDWEAMLRLQHVPRQSLRICLYHRLEALSPELIQALESGELTALVCVSHWQHQTLLADSTGINPLLNRQFSQRMHVAPPSVAPAFSLKYQNPQRLLQNKVAPLTLACSGLAGPGLKMLFKMLPKLRERFPSLRLWFLPAPQAGPEAQSTHARLLAQTSIGKNMAYKGLNGDEELAEVLRQTHVMAYPASHPESDSLAIRQALACGCRVVCPDLGALAEVSRGWSRLVPQKSASELEGSFWLDYIDALSEELARWQDAQATAFQLLQQSWAIATNLESSQTAIWWQDLIQELKTSSLPTRHIKIRSRPADSQKTKLRWCFLDPGEQDYLVTSPESIPLGGSQSMVCFLARELAARGHQVTLVNQTSQPGTHLGVKCMRQATLPKGFWKTQNFDLVVALNNYQSLLQVPGRRVFWNHHNPGVPDIASLAAVQPQLAAVVYVSAWQQAVFQDVFGLPRGQLIPNGCSPFYSPMPMAAKLKRTGPVTLAYTSNPGRGLGLLLNLFPALRQRFPDLRLKVFSSLQTYQGNPEQEARFQPLYAQARQLDGVEYLGAVPQPQLAAALTEVQILAYPSIYEESFCLAALEAMAAGCQIVSSSLAALPETTAGYASLVPFSFQAREFSLNYFEALSSAIATWQTDPQGLVPRLQQQSHFAIEAYSWQRQVIKWEALARQLISEIPA